MANYVSLVGEWHEVNTDGVPLTQSGKQALRDYWAVIMGRIFSNAELADASVFDLSKPKALELAVSDFIKDSISGDDEVTKSQRTNKIKDIVRDVGLGKK